MACTDACIGGAQQRRFLACSGSLYALFVPTQGAV
jgi:hypothetical protein